MKVYVVRKDFRSYGVFYPVGTVLTSLEGIRTPSLKLSRRILWEVETEDLVEDVKQLEILTAKSGRSIREAIKKAVAAAAPEEPIETPEIPAVPKPVEEAPAPKSSPAKVAGKNTKPRNTKPLTK